MESLLNVVSRSKGWIVDVGQFEFVLTWSLSRSLILVSAPLSAPSSPSLCAIGRGWHFMSCGLKEESLLDLEPELLSRAKM